MRARYAAPCAGLASLFFYGFWQPKYLLLLLASIVVNYGLGHLIARSRNRAVLTAGIVGNLSVLGYYKYAGLAVESLDFLFGCEWTITAPLLPLALSFFTFQQIAFLVDTYRGLPLEASIERYTLFVTFFPQLIAGPIVHHREMLPQFESTSKRRDIKTDIAIGLSVLTIGLFKKVAIADNLSPYANAVFGAAEAGTPLSFVEAWLGTLHYTFQLYFDFSGYSDMAVGSARLFGIVLPANFASPYKAKNIIDFWRRWHITLSRFLRDYLYFPLGGNRSGRARRYGNLMATMALGGLWHGAGWNFLLWGVLHGTYLIINHGFRYAFPISDAGLKRSVIRNGWGWALTFLAVAVAWVPFRAESFAGSTRMLAGMIGENGLGKLPRALEAVLQRFGGSLTKTEPVINLWEGVAWAAAAAVVAMSCPNTQEFMADGDIVLERVQRPRWLAWSMKPVWGWALGILAFYALMDLGKRSEFLYFRF